MSDFAKIPGLNRLRERTKGDPRVCVAILDGPVHQPQCLSLSRAPRSCRASLAHQFQTGRSSFLKDYR
jgi:hypothetical protein